MIDKAWLSILGLYKYDSSIFDNLTIPKASELDLALPYMLDVVEDLSEETLEFKILMDLAELPLVYTDPDTVKYMIGRWSAARKPIWRELWKTTLYKYVPIWNKDGVIDETRSLETTGTSAGSLSDKTAGSHSDTVNTHKVTTTDQDTSETNSGTDSGTLDRETVTDQDTTESKRTVTDQDTTASGTTSGTGSLNRTVSHNVTGYDTDAYAADTQDVTSESTTTSGTSSDTGTNDVTETLTGSGTNDVTETVDEDTTGTWSESRAGTNDVEVEETGSVEDAYSSTGSLDRETEGETSGTEDETLHRVEQGNIGIVTTQQMIKEQREIVLLDMYQVMTDEFKKQFCIMVY